VDTVYVDINKPKDRIRNKVLVVEGPDDAYFFDSILQSLGIDPEGVGIVILGGIGNLKSNLANLKKSRPFVEGRISRVAVVRDADYDRAASLADLEDAIRGNGFPHGALGQFAEFEAGKSIGCYMLPPDDGTGNLESLLLATVEGDLRVQWSGELFARVEAQFGELDRRHKRLMQLFLACRPEDCRGPGRAFHLGAFPRDSGALAGLKGFLEAFLT
jgi:hypothetical protein